MFRNSLRASCKHSRQGSDSIHLRYAFRLTSHSATREHRPAPSFQKQTKSVAAGRCDATYPAQRTAVSLVSVRSVLAQVYAATSWASGPRECHRFQDATGRAGRLRFLHVIHDAYSYPAGPVALNRHRRAVRTPYALNRHRIEPPLNVRNSEESSVNGLA